MRSALALATLLLVTACESSPEDLREWRASDHDHTSEPGNDQVEVPPDGGPTPELAAHGLDEVTIVAWQQNCTRCHGTIGRGDGPQGASLRAADLTDAAWQSSVKDDQIARTIREGRGAMPPFALPDSTITGLVHLIRLLDASRARPAPAGDESPEPATSVPAAALSGQPPANVREGAAASAKAKVSDPGQGHTAPAKPAPVASSPRSP
jgi:mono/diheme cytochrome c family protein